MLTWLFSLVIRRVAIAWPAAGAGQLAELPYQGASAVFNMK